MWGPRSRGDGEAAALDRLVPTDSVNRASLNSNIMPGVSDCLAVMQGAVINRRLVEALRVEVGLIDKGAGNRRASTTKRGTRIDRLLVADQVSARFTAPLP